MDDWLQWVGTDTPSTNGLIDQLTEANVHAAVPSGVHEDVPQQ